MDWWRDLGKHSVCPKGEQFLDHVIDYQLLNKNSAALSQFHSVLHKSDYSRQVSEVITGDAGKDLKPKHSVMSTIIYHFEIPLRSDICM
jgi:hypothetical protein